MMEYILVLLMMAWYALFIYLTEGEE
jgi:hypothetical protein